MKKVLLQLCGVICLLISLNSCSQESIIVDDVQYISNSMCCSSSYKDSWVGSSVTIEGGGNIQFQSQLSGQLFIDVEDGFPRVFRNGKKVFDAEASGFCTLLYVDVKSGDKIKISSSLLFADNTIKIKNVKIIGTEESTDSDLDF